MTRTICYFVGTHGDWGGASRILFNLVRRIDRQRFKPIVMLSQTVLLRGINSSTRSLRALFRGLLRARVRPYYLFQGDTVIGTDHLRTPVDAAIALYGSLRGWMSGMCIPHLVIDAPGGGGKLPIGPDYIVERHPDKVVVRTYRGELVDYPEPRERDCAVPYDEVYFAGQPEDDDREGSAEAAPPL